MIHDNWQKNIPVIKENDDDNTEFTKSQNIEQELIKELLSSIIAPSISSEVTEDTFGFTSIIISKYDAKLSPFILEYNTSWIRSDFILALLFN